MFLFVGTCFNLTLTLGDIVMKHMTRKEIREIGFNHIFDIAEKDLPRAMRLLSHVKVVFSDIDVLMGYREADDSFIRDLAVWSAMRIPVESLKLDVLMGYQKKNDSSVRNFAAWLAMMIPARNLERSELMEYRESDNVYVVYLAGKLLAARFPDDRESQNSYREDAGILYMLEK